MPLVVSLWTLSPAHKPCKGTLLLPCGRCGRYFAGFFLSVKSTSLHYLSTTLEYRRSIKPFTFRTISSKRQAVNDCLPIPSAAKPSKNCLIEPHCVLDA